MDSEAVQQSLEQLNTSIATQEGGKRETWSST